MEALQQREITVFAIAQGASLLYRRLNTLTRYANPTGGAVFYPERTVGLLRPTKRSHRWPATSTYSAYAPKGSVESITFRKLEVRLTSKSIKADRIRSRNGYYATPH